jgi:hypothetical protein
LNAAHEPHRGFPEREELLVAEKNAMPRRNLPTILGEGIDAGFAFQLAPPDQAAAQCVQDGFSKDVVH